MNEVAAFLVHLRDVRKFKVPTIAGYRSVLSSVQRWVGTSVILSELLASFRLEIPPVVNPVPRWYLDVVLRYLRSDIFEPLASVSFRLLSMKTLFLVSLATAKRVSELQACCSSVGWREGNAVLSYVPSFRAKTESASNPLPRYFEVKGLSDLVGQEPERFWCPVSGPQVLFGGNEGVQGFL